MDLVKPVNIIICTHGTSRCLSLSVYLFCYIVLFLFVYFVIVCLFCYCLFVLLRVLLQIKRISTRRTTIGLRD